MAAGDIARKYIDFLTDLENDEDYQKLGKLKYMPFPNADEIYNEAVRDYLQARLSGEWNE